MHILLSERSDNLEKAKDSKNISSCHKAWEEGEMPR